MEAGYSKEIRRILEKIKMVRPLRYSLRDSARPAFRTNLPTKTS
jgi:hypothetical protein